MSLLRDKILKGRDIRRLALRGSIVITTYQEPWNIFEHRLAFSQHKAMSRTSHNVLTAPHRAGGVFP